MSWADALQNINYLAVLLGVLASVVLGVVWYNPKVWGVQWSKLVGLKKKDLKNKNAIPVSLTMSLIFYFLASVVIASLLEMTAATGPGEGVLMGAIVGFVFGYGPLSVTYLYARRRFELSMIDGGYIVVTMAVIGAIIGAIS